MTLATRQTPEQPKALPDTPPLGKNLPTPAAAQIRAAFKAWPNGSLATMEQLGREYPKDPVVQLYRGLALLLGRLRRRRRRRAAQGEEGRPRHAVGGAGRQRAPSRVPGRLPDLPPARGEPRCSSRARASRSRGTSTRRSRSTRAPRAPRRTTPRPRSPLRSRCFDKDNLNPAFSRLGPLTQQFPKSQTRALLPRSAAAWTGQKDPAVAQFEKVVALGPQTDLGTERSGVPRSNVQKPGTSPSTK